MTDPIQFGANPQTAPNRNNASETEVRFEQRSSTSYRNSESTVVRLSSAEPARPLTAASAAEALGPEQAANNVLQFIAQRLAALKAGGADSESLRNALEDAREGFATGLAQATEILSAGGKLDDSQQQRIERIEARFAEGVESIAAQLSGGQEFEDEVAALTRDQAGRALARSDEPDVVASVPATPATDTAATTATNSPDGDTSSSPVAVQFSASESFNSKFKSNSVVANQRTQGSDNDRSGDFARGFIERYQSTRASFKRSESVSLQLRTQDGDIITLDFSAKQKGKFRIDSQFGLEQQNSRAFAKLFGSSELNISVIGDIDNGELAALENLFDQLGELFNRFFSGDSGAALEQALSLDIDASEIAQLGVDLQLREEQKLVQKYREVASFGGGDDASSLPRSLGDYLEQIRDIALTNNKSSDKSLLEQLLSISFAGGDLAVDQSDADDADDDRADDREDD